MRGSSTRVLTSCRRTAEVDTNGCPVCTLQAIQVCPVQDTVPHPQEELVKVRPAKVRARLQLSERVDFGTNGVENNVVGCVNVQLLGQVGVDLQELHAGAAGQACRLDTLLLEGGEQGLEPLEGARVLAHPDELDTAKTTGRIGAVAQMPYVLEDGCPGCDTDTGTDQNRDFVLKDVLCRGTVRAIDADRWHLLAVLQGHLVHAHRVDSLRQLRLSSSGTDGVTKRPGKVADLADVD